MKRLSITLTDSQSAALERIAAETGATRQSMIGLAISAWISDYEHDALMERLRKERVERELDRRDAQADRDDAAQMAFDAEVCEVCGAPAEWASVGVDGKEHLYCDNHSAHHLLKCEVCGAPATGGCIGPDGQHLYCEMHRILFED